MYPEGTRTKPYRIVRSQNYAKSKGYTPLEHHLFPRTKGFVLSVRLMRGKMGAIYHSVLAFRPEDKHKATFISLLTGNKVEAYIYCKRIPFEEVPYDDEGCAQYLRDMFVTKVGTNFCTLKREFINLFSFQDRLLDSFLNTGDFFKESGVQQPILEPITFERSYSTLIKTFVWSSITLAPIFNFFMNNLNQEEKSVVISILLTYYICEYKFGQILVT